MSSIVRLSLPLLACVVLAGGAAPVRAAAPPARPAPLRTVTYAVHDLVGVGRARTGYARIEDVARPILTTVSPEAWGEKGGCTLEMVNDTELVVTAPEALHAEVRSVLAHLRGLAETSVRVRCELVEIDRKTFERSLRPALKDRLMVAVFEETAEALRKAGRVRRSGKVYLGQGKEGGALSLRRGFTYAIGPKEGPWSGERFAIAETGLSVRAGVRVTPDRREVDLKVVQRVTEKVADDDVVKFDTQTDKEFMARVPRLADSVLTANLRVEDGVTVAMPVHGKPLAVKGKDRVLLLLVQPLIVIDSEERERSGM